jgi:hypothetical protein
MFIFRVDSDLFTDINLTILPFQVKGGRVDMPRPFQMKDQPIQPGRTYPWPLQNSEYIIFTRHKGT